MNSPRLEIDDLAAVIRESMTAQQNNHAPPAVAQTVSPESGRPQLKLQPDFKPRSDHQYHVNDLLRYHDRAFVRAAYSAVLKRSPDDVELSRELTRLGSGDVNKIDLLAALRFSPEGRAKGVQLNGLMFPALMRRLGRLPLLGYFIRLGIALVRLPNMVRDQREFGSYMLAQNREMADYINLTTGDFTERVDSLAHEFQQYTRLTDFNLLRLRVGDLTEPEFEAVYAALEDRFRGTRDQVKENAKVYLPYVKENTPVIDLGCGRGEWLELLSENEIEARGVDTNSMQLEQCRARGLDVTEEDFFSYLERMPANSAGAITGFHVLEHLSFNVLLKLLNEVLRVLRPGGVAIFETPNPENTVVGSHYFYLDPTHRHPLPSELMEFVFKNRGFEQIEVLPLHPWESGRVAGDGELAERFNGYFYGPMDYAVVGRKVRA